jgi:ribosomal protein S18 acetylase RimI-like enzyme
MASLFAQYSPRDPATPRRAAPPGLRFDVAGVEDREGIVQLISEREGFARDQAAERADRFLAAAVESSLMLVARIAQSVAGYGRVTFTKKPTEPGFECVPEGWYLSGVIVGEAFRRQGIARELTRQRLNWISERADEAFYFANSSNRASIDLHEQFGFREVMRDFRYPHCTFTNGIGILFRLELG